MTERVAPLTADELAVVLCQASERAQPVVPWGAGTLQRLGAEPPPGASILRTTALNRIVEYHPPDLTITVEAGVALETLEAMLAEHGQWLPWLPPAPGRATVGGLLAAGAGGPLRLGYGAPRDWVLGMQVALADGRLVKSGGKVVKNVAGYDTHKLHIGALGTLGVMTTVTFKVFPRPEHSGALLVGCADRAGALALAERLRERPLAPVSLALLAGGVARRLAEQARAAKAPQTAGLPQALLAVRFDGPAAAVERQLRAATDSAAGCGALVVQLSDTHGQAVWRELSTFAALASEALTPDPSPSRGRGEDATVETLTPDPFPNCRRGESQELLIRAGARPATLGAVLEALEQHAPDDVESAGYAGVGLAYARWRLPDSIDAAALGRMLEVLRAALAAAGGYAVVEDAPDRLRAMLDLWGAPPPTLPLMRALKAQWDPQGILNPGRYIRGL
jgi:glycolate oxidase FAD binding subunit